MATLAVLTGTTATIMSFALGYWKDDPLWAYGGQGAVAGSDGRPRRGRRADGGPSAAAEHL